MYIARKLGGARLTSGQMRASSLFSIKPNVKMHFFDRSVIKTRWPKFNRDPLMHAGNLVMRIARGSIKRRVNRDKPSRPGTPPFSHADTPDTKYGKRSINKRGRRANRTPPFKQIFSVPIRFHTGVIVGMVGYRHVGPAVPGLHEHSGPARRKVFRKLGQRRLRSGMWGKMQTSYKAEMVRYPKRPFMWPALMKARNRLPRLWLNSLGHSRGS